MPEAMESVLIPVVLVAMLAGFVQGASGFAFALITTALWAWMIEPQLLVPTVVMTSLLAHLISVSSVRHQVSAGRTAPFLVGGMLGVPLGVLILPLLDAMLFRLCIGGILIIHCTVMLQGRLIPRVAGGGRLADGGVGLIAGVMGGATGVSGPPIVLWCVARGWDKEVQRATFQSFFIGVQLVIVGLYLVRGVIDARALHLVLVAALPIALSAWLGSRFFNNLSGPQFRTVVFGLLLISGVALFVPSFVVLVR